MCESGLQLGLGVEALDIAIHGGDGEGLPAESTFDARVRVRGGELAFDDDVVPLRRIGASLRAGYAG